MERVSSSRLHIQSAKSEADARNHTPVACVIMDPEKKLNLKSACFCYWWNWIAGTFANRSDGNAKYGVQRLLRNLATHLNLFSGIRNSGQKYGEQQRHSPSAAVRCSLSERHMPALHDVTVSLDMQIFDGSSTRQSSQVPAGISRRDQSRMQLWNRFELLPKKTKTFLRMDASFAALL